MIDGIQPCIGKIIKSIECGEYDDAHRYRDGKYRDDHGSFLALEFTDGTTALLRDKPSCCETRVMSSDDDLPYYVGSVLMDVDLREGGETEDDGGDCHEWCFLLITTSLGVVTVCSHNYHNGYYGGMHLELSILDLKPQPQT